MPWPLSARVRPASVPRPPRRGGSVVLIDSADRFGGSVTAAMHRGMCGLYSQEPRRVLDTLNGSAQRGIVERMLRKEPLSVRARQFGKAWVLEFPVRALETILSEICCEAKVDLRMRSRVTAVRRAGTRVTALQVEDSEARWIEVNGIIDCTGGGNVLRMVGEEAFQPDQTAGRILGGFSVRLAGLAGDPEIQRLQTAYVLARAVDADLLPRLARFTSFSPGPEKGEGVCKLAIDPNEMGTPEAEAFAHQVVAHLKREIAGFAGARIMELSTRVLPRDGLRLRGKYTVTEEDILQARKHGADSVHAWWPMERWDISDGPSYEFPPVGEHYDIPHNALRSAAIENLFAAGTCLSATSGAAASVRRQWNMPGYRRGRRNPCDIRCQSLEFHPSPGDLSIHDSPLAR